MTEEESDKLMKPCTKSFFDISKNLWIEVESESVKEEAYVPR